MDEDEEYLYEECASCAFRDRDDPADICTLCEDGDMWEEDMSEESRVIPIRIAA